MKKKSIKTLAIWGLMFIAVLFLFPMIGVADQSPETMAFGLSGLSLLPLAGFTKLYGRPIFDWKAVKEFGTEKELMAAIMERFTDFCKELSGAPLQTKALFGEKFTGADSNLAGASPVVLVHYDRTTPDRGYEKIFDPIDMRQSRSKTFEILNVSGGVTYYETKDGEPAKLSRIPTTAKTAVEAIRYTGGFSVLDDYLRYNEYYKIDQLAAQAVRDWYKKRATLMYALVTALTGIDQAFDTNDMTTINNACANILNDLDAAGYDVGDGSEFVILCNPLLKGRMLKAIKAAYENPGNNAQKIEYSITALVTTPKVSSSNYWVGLPGEKARLGDWEDLNARPAQRNEMLLGSDNVWTGAYNAAIGEKKQFKKCALS